MALANLVPAPPPAASRRTFRGRTLAIGLGAEAQRAFAIAADQAALLPAAEDSVGACDAWLDENHPLAIVIEGDTRRIEETCSSLRERPALANVPIVGIADEVDDLAFETMFSAGGDDLVPRGAADALARRLRGFATTGDVPHSKTRGIAILADKDRRARVLAGRALRNAGYGVVFALDAEEALIRARDPNVELIVSAADLEGATGPTLAARARAAGAKAAWVVMTPPREVARMRARLAHVERAGAHDAFGPPENVLFLANELVKGGVVENRKSPRVLYGTTVRFRAAGAASDEIGYTFNLSAGGVYVRTLAPLARGVDAWIELDPPRCDRRVRLEGKVAWSRAFGPNDVATVPAGFGLQITGGSIADLERFTRGYRTFASEVC